ncbi:hypothetical protein OPV22_014768 [Ensete ventricosum]|uniref:Uncharacterized protein n=1 Tax=Ensete ventricosum TaxID=4639 RepID=A0AAV8RC60_ENSVE|nr:hypothetical protein OPV22_014768 [Ensete ventricosum]
MGLEVTVACPPRRDEPVTSARTGGVHRKRSVTVRHRNRSCKGSGARYHRTRVGLATIRGGGPPTTHPGKEHHDVAMVHGGAAGWWRWDWSGGAASGVGDRMLFCEAGDRLFSSE